MEDVRAEVCVVSIIYNAAMLKCKSGVTWKG